MIVLVLLATLVGCSGVVVLVVLFVLVLFLGFNVS